MDNKSGLNFPPDHSTTAASISANNAAAAAAAAAATNNGSSNGLLASTLSMQNLVTLASMNHGTSAAQHNTAYGSAHYNLPPSTKTLTAAVTHPGHMAHYTIAAHHLQSQQQQQSHHQQQQQLHHHAQHHQAMAVATPTYAAHITGGTTGPTLCKYCICKLVSIVSRYPLSTSSILIY